MNDNTQQNMAETIRDLSVAGSFAALVAGPGTSDVIKLPPGFSLRSLEDFKATPDRIRQNIVLDDPSNFAEYIKRFKTNGSIILRANTNTRFMAILDFHEHSGCPAWGEHRCTLELRKTTEWETWASISKRGFIHQLELAEFLELNTLGIVEPSAAHILELTRTIKGARNAVFESGTRLQNGDTTLRYQVTTTAKAGEKGDLDIPEHIDVQIPIFVGMPGTTIRVKLFWRIHQEDGSASFALRIPDLATIIDLASSNIASGIEKATGITVWRGWL